MDAVFYGFRHVVLMNPDFEKMIEAENSAVFDGLLPALNSDRQVSVRFNPLKAASVPCAVAGEPLGSPVKWEPRGYYLDRRPLFTLDPAMHQGVYYVQEASSMLVGETVRRIVEVHEGMCLNVLDACAAPGGKTTSVLSVLAPGSALIANEYDYGRAEILKENLYKWGNPSVAVTRGDTARFARLGNCFDMIIADVPCSGEGMFRKNEEARAQWSPALVEQCAALQREIIGNIVGSLKPGGYLLYSTCTFNTMENERNVEYFRDEWGLECVDVDRDAEWNISGAVNSDVPVSRMLPSRVRGEGFFLAVMRKPGKLKAEHAEVRQSRRNAPVQSVASQWVDGLEVRNIDGTVWGATPELWRLVGELEKKKIDFIGIGCEIARIKGKDMVPHHGLALSTALKRGSFPEVTVDRDEALRFLRKENIDVPAETPKGYVLLVYDSTPLGFVKNLGNRTNNLLPKEWRVRI